MNEKNLQKYLEENIPLYEKSGFQIIRINEEEVRIFGKLEENRNPHKTAFGGSLAVILLMAAWAKVLEIMNRNDRECSIVVARQSVEYLIPVKGDFTARAMTPDPDILREFFPLYHDRGKGRLKVEAQLMQNGSDKVCAIFEGVFSIKKRPSGK